MVDINSPLEDIAQDIADKYLLRPFPQKISSNGLLDYTQIRKHKIDPTRLERPIHGYQNACRMAGLIPVLIKLYKKYAAELPTTTQTELASITELEIKKVQIVVMLRSTGRTQDGGSGIEFCEQGKKECLHYLQSIGITDAKERERLAHAIVASERVNSEDLVTCLIADASTIETFRDVIPFKRKTIYITYFAFFKLLQQPISADAIDDFLKITFHHLKLIRQHQGFLLSTIKGFDNEPISEHSPTLDKLVNFDEQIQLKIEHQPNSFKKINEEVSVCSQILEDANTPKALSNTTDLFSKLADEINNIPTFYPDQTTILKTTINFFVAKIGKIYNCNGSLFNLSGSEVKKYLNDKYNNWEQICKNYLLITSLISINYGMICLIFKDRDDSHFGQEVIKILLADKFPELAKIERNAIGNYFVIALTKEQFKHLTSEPLSTIAKVGCDFNEFIDAVYDKLLELAEAVNKNDSDKLTTLLKLYPGLLRFSDFAGNRIVHLVANLNNLSLLKMLLDTYSIDINAQNKAGLTPLFMACQKGHLDMVKFLTSAPNIRFSLASYTGQKTPLDIAIENNHTEIVKHITGIQDSLLQEIRKNSDGIQYSSFETYALTLRKTPTNQLYWNYLWEIRSLTLKNKPIVKGPYGKTVPQDKSIEIRPTRTEAKFIETRKVWSEVVSETFKENDNYCAIYDVKQLVIARLKKLAVTNDFELLYRKCLECLRNYSVITITFDASFLKDQGLTDFQILNIFEKDNRNSPPYTENRKATEKTTFSFLSPRLKKAFFENLHARPRYGTLQLIDDKNAVKWTAAYGQSFIVFKDITKLNAIFCPSDSLNYCTEHSGYYKVCTIHHLELILLQCPEKTFKAIIKKVTTGVFDKDFSQNQSNHATGGYIEVMLPPISLFSPANKQNDLIEAVFFDQNTYSPQPEEIELLKEFGINILYTKQGQTPYVELTKVFIEAIKKNDANNVAILLTKYPSLRTVTTKEGHSPIHVAAKYGSLDVLKLFNIHKFSFTSLSHGDNSTALQLAAYHGQEGAFKYILENVVHETGNDKKTIINQDRIILFITKSAKFNLNLLNLILMEGPNIEVTDNNGLTALHLTVLNEQLAAAELLIEKGMDLKIFLKIANQATVFSSDKKIFFLFIKNYSQRILNKINSTEYKEVTNFIEQNPSVALIPYNEKNQNLMHVCANNNLNHLLKIILRQNASDINVKDIDGNTPLHLAGLATNSNIAIFELLLQHKADILATNKKGETVLHIFISNMNKCGAEQVGLTLNHLAMQDQAGPLSIPLPILKLAINLIVAKELYHLSLYFSKKYLKEYIADLEKSANSIKAKFFGLDKQYSAAKALQNVIDGTKGPETLAQHQHELQSNELALICKAVKSFIRTENTGVISAPLLK